MLQLNNCEGGDDLNVHGRPNEPMGDPEGGLKDGTGTRELLVVLLPHRLHSQVVEMREVGMLLFLSSSFSFCLLSQDIILDVVFFCGKSAT